MKPARILPVFRDEEREVIALLRAYFAAKGLDLHFGDQTPIDEELDDVLPFVRVGRVGGATRSGSEHTDRPVVDIDVLAKTRGEAKAISQEIEQVMLSAPHPIDYCNVLMAPQRVVYVEGQPYRRFYASYQLGLRRSWPQQ